MSLGKYSREEIEAAIKIKGLNHVSLAKQLNRSTSAVSRAIKGIETINSESLKNDILETLNPELDKIHNTFKTDGGSPAATA